MQEVSGLRKCIIWGYDKLAFLACGKDTFLAELERRSWLRIASEQIKYYMPSDLRLFPPSDALADHRHIFTSVYYRDRAAMASDAQYAIPMKAHRDLSEIRFGIDWEELLQRWSCWRRAREPEQLWWWELERGSICDIRYNAAVRALATPAQGAPN